VGHDVGKIIIAGSGFDRPAPVFIECDLKAPAFLPANAAGEHDRTTICTVSEGKGG
jgi:hypothetical protein